MPGNSKRATSSNSVVQAVYFIQPVWSETKAKKWLADHNYHPIKTMHPSGDEMRYRLQSPDKFARFTTKVLPNGVHLVLGHLS
jgi:hypothetical protein